MSLQKKTRPLKVLCMTGLTLIGALICCWWCKGCALYKCRKRNKKNESARSLFDSSSSSLDHLTALSTSSASTNTIENLARSNSSALGLTSASLYPPTGKESAFSKRKRTRYTLKMPRPFWRPSWLNEWFLPFLSGESWT